MSKLQTIRNFQPIKEAFESGSYDLGTVATLLSEIRANRNNLSGRQAMMLLEIPLNVLKEDVQLKTRESWAMENRTYFSGNMNSTGDAYLDQLKQTFESGVFKLQEIYDLTAYVRANFISLDGRVEFLLRNAESTLSFDAQLMKGSTFYDTGRAFAKHIEIALYQ